MLGTLGSSPWATEASLALRLPRFSPVDREDWAFDVVVTWPAWRFLGGAFGLGGLEGFELDDEYRRARGRMVVPLARTAAGVKLERRGDAGAAATTRRTDEGNMIGRAVAREVLGGWGAGAGAW